MAGSMSISSVDCCFFNPYSNPDCYVRLAMSLVTVTLRLGLLPCGEIELGHICLAGK